MPLFKVSQAERWHRRYLIQAESLEEAKQFYNTYLETGEEGEETEGQPYMVGACDPEFLDDLEDDTEWFKE